jgi:hypothetical protein
MNEPIMSILCVIGIILIVTNGCIVLVFWHCRRETFYRDYIERKGKK